MEDESNLVVLINAFSEIDLEMITDRRRSLYSEIGRIFPGGSSGHASIEVLAPTLKITIFCIPGRLPCKNTSSKTLLGLLRQVQSPRA